MSAFLLTVREGLEAVLVVSILMGTLRRLGRMNLARYVWLGVGGAVAVSLAAAAALSAASIELAGPTKAIYESPACCSRKCWGWAEPGQSRAPIRHHHSLLGSVRCRGQRRDRACLATCRQRFWLFR
jgi:hypothetical protein